jgi:hypothetical protein
MTLNESSVNLFSPKRKMSNPFGDNKSFLAYQLKWIGIYLGISIALSLLIPFPLSIVAFIGAFLAIQLGRAVMLKRRQGINNIRDFFNPRSTAMFKPQEIKYYCMSCGTQHNLRECPNCGSKMKRI